MGRTLTVPNTPVKLSRTPGGVRGLPPDVGEQTEDVLRDWLGLTADEIHSLEDAGVVTQATGAALPLPPEILGER
jgi:crotonobetainyl-CoA:carnitine CoA-transferase CaiB-like acyl-CoA transferase